MGDGNAKAMETKPTVFVSYSRDDQKRVLPIIELIRKARYGVWWDGMIEGGERFSRTTDAALESARAVVVFWSETSIASHWVHDEATTGRDHNCLVPLSLDGSQPPLGFRQFQTIDISKARIRAGDPAIQSMLHAIAALHDHAFESAAPPARDRLRIDRRVVLAGTGALVAGGLGAAWFAGWFAPASKDSSVAVLPFENMSGDPDQGYFAAGLASEVRSELARNPLLQVVGQASSNAVREMKGDALAIASKLGVAFLVDGNVRRAGETVRVSAELIDGGTGISRWTQTYERPLADIFAVQSEIAHAVARAITARVQAQDYSASDREAGGTNSVAAYDAHLRAQELFEAGGSAEVMRGALALLDQAIAADPRYGRARAFRAAVLGFLALFAVRGDERMELLRESLAEARRAVAMSPNCAPAFLALGTALFGTQLDARSARAQFDRARQLGAGETVVLANFALFCARTGRFAEARSAIGLAATLDPLSANTFALKSSVEYLAGDCPAAIAAGHEALRLNPKLGISHGPIGTCHLQQGDLAAARVSFTAMPVSEFRLAGLAMVAQREGKQAEAEGYLRKLVALRGDDSAYRQAQVLAQWGRRDKALAAIELAFRIRDSNLTGLGQDPLFDPLRGTPQFRAMKQRMGFD
jgi:TolB-like protein/Tfp pilus assembly protein PilF